MNQISFGTLLQWISRPFNTTVNADRLFLVDQANRVREKLYNAYREFELEVDVEECFELQSFCKCGLCEDSYQGITLPSYMETIEAAWFSREPITLYSKWRESKVGIKFSQDCQLASYDMPGFYSTERDLCPCDCPDFVQFLAKSRLDNGKIVRIRYESDSGEDIADDVPLVQGQWVGSSGKVKHIKSILLPSGLYDGVSVRQTNGDRMLSEYAPNESVPAYRRVKFTGLCGKSVVIVRASRKFTPLFNDHDIVEFANRDVIEDVARHIFYSNSGSDTGMIQKAEYHRSLYRESLKGAQSRQIGINRENSSSAMGAPVRRSRLVSGRNHFIR